MKPTLRDKVLKTISLSKHTDLTITNMSELKSELEKISEEGVGIDNGEYLDGMVAIAVPVINKENAMNFALAIHAPSSRKSIDELRQYLPILRKAAAKMAEAENVSA
jgi:DNA-binding IclR family transcriptional regulator